MQAGETVMDCGASAPSVGAIHHVVVDEGASLEELEGRGYAYRGVVEQGVAGIATCAPPAPIAKCRTQPFTSGQELVEGFAERDEIRADTGKETFFLPEGGSDDRLDPRTKLRWVAAGF